MVGNKNDMYEFEQVEESEAQSLAKSLNAIFHLTSAKSGEGIEELFEKIGKQFNNSDLSILNRAMRQEKKPHDKKMKLNKKKGKTEKKRNCC